MTFRSKSQLRALILVVGVVVAAFGGAVAAKASPQFGDDCTGCHQSNARLPAAHPPLSAMSSSQCVSCHRTSSSAPPAAITTVAPAQSTVQVQVQDQHQDREQEQEREQEQARLQRTIGRPISSDTELRGQHDAGKGSHAHDAPLSPWDFRMTLGLLSSSDLAQHHSNSIFYGNLDGLGSLAGASNEGESPSGSRIHLGALAKYSVDLGARTELAYGLKLTRDRFVEEDLNRTNARLSSEWKRKTDNEIIKLETYLQRITFDGAGAASETDHTSLGANLTYHSFVSSTGVLSTSLRARRSKYDGETAWRHPDFSLSIGMADKLQGDVEYSYGLAFLSRNNPKRARNRYFSQSLFASLQKPVNGRLTFGVSGEFGLRDYGAPDEHTGVTRSDRFWDVGIEAYDDLLRIFGSVPRLSCHYTQTNSNIATSDSEAAYCAVMVEKRF
ncbi:surface lipoprotein assembly modifier [Thalassovita taeanensis]|nr:surface lipoprotein assembly modifier [Thalassovita taeanensis]